MGQSNNIHIRVSKDLKDQIAKAAARDEISQSAWLKLAAKNQLRKRDKNVKPKNSR